MLLFPQRSSFLVVNTCSNTHNIGSNEGNFDIDRTNTSDYCMSNLAANRKAAAFAGAEYCS